MVMVLNKKAHAVWLLLTGTSAAVARLTQETQFAAGPHVDPHAIARHAGLLRVVARNEATPFGPVRP